MLETETIAGCWNIKHTNFHQHEFKDESNIHLHTKSYLLKLLCSSDYVRGLNVIFILFTYERAFFMLGCNCQLWEEQRLMFFSWCCKENTYTICGRYKHYSASVWVPHWGSKQCLCNQGDEENVEGRCVQSPISCREKLSTYIMYVGCNWLTHVFFSIQMR